MADGTGREGRFAACGLEGLSGSHQPYSLLSRLSQVLDGSSGLHTPAAGAGCVQASPGPDMHAHLRPLTLVRAFNTSSGSLSSGSGSSSNSTSDIEPPSPATDFAARGSSSGKDCGSSNSSSNSTSGGGRAAAGPRGKAAARAKAAAAAAAAAQSLLPAAHHAHPAARGAKGKAGKAPGAKAAAASVAVKSGGQRPLSVEARRQLDLQLEGLAAQGVVGGGASRKPAVKAVGFYIGEHCEKGVGGGLMRYWLRVCDWGLVLVEVVAAGVGRRYLVRHAKHVLAYELAKLFGNQQHHGNNTVKTLRTHNARTHTVFALCPPYPQKLNTHTRSHAQARPSGPTT